MNTFAQTAPAQVPSASTQLFGVKPSADEVKPGQSSEFGDVVEAQSAGAESEMRPDAKSLDYTAASLDIDPQSVAAERTSQKDAQKGVQTPEDGRAAQRPQANIAGVAAIPGAAALGSEDYPVAPDQAVRARSTDLAAIPAVLQASSSAAGSKDSAVRDVPPALGEDLLARQAVDRDTTAAVPKVEGAPAVEKVLPQMTRVVGEEIAATVRVPSSDVPSTADPVLTAKSEIRLANTDVGRTARPDSDRAEGLVPQTAGVASDRQTRIGQAAGVDTGLLRVEASSDAASPDRIPAESAADLRNTRRGVDVVEGSGTRAPEKTRDGTTGEKTPMAAPAGQQDSDVDMVPKAVAKDGPMGAAAGWYPGEQSDRIFPAAASSEPFTTRAAVPDDASRPMAPATVASVATQARESMRAAVDEAGSKTQKAARRDADVALDITRDAAGQARLEFASLTQAPTAKAPALTAFSALQFRLQSNLGDAAGAEGSGRFAADVGLSDVGLSELRATETRGLSEPPVHSRPEVPRQTMAQLADVARFLPDGPVEVSLSPEELGKVRMQLSGVEGAMTVQIMAERPETLDLLRRHIDILAADLRDMGFGTLDFSFSGGTGADSEGGPGPSFAAAEPSGVNEDRAAPVGRIVRDTLAQSDRLDLRL